MSEIYAPGAIAGPQGPVGPAGSAAAVSALSSALLPSFAGRNLFDLTTITAATQVNAADGSLTIGGQPSNATALIYCAGAISMVCNLAINAANWGGAICLYDANGNFMEALPTASGITLVNGFVQGGIAFTLPGTQTYVRFGYLTGKSGYGWQSDSVGMVYATASGTATLPASYSPPGIDTVADVNAKIAAVASTTNAAIAGFTANIGTSFAEFNRIMLGNPTGGVRNALDRAHILENTGVHQDGTITTESGWTSAWIFAPGATQFNTNLPVFANVNLGSFTADVCCYDAFGNFLCAVGASNGLSGSVNPNQAYTLPGNQTYVAITWSRGHYGWGPYNGFKMAASDGAALFMIGDATNPCPATGALPACAPSFSSHIAGVKYATELGADPSGAADSTAVLNAFLATASATNPIRLILDGYFGVTGLVIAAAGYTTIEGNGPGTGVFILENSESPNDVIRLGPYTASVGNSEGAYNLAVPAQAAKNIVLRNFLVQPNSQSGENGETNAAANQPASGDPAHSTYGIMLASATDIVVDGLTFLEAAPNYCLCLSNVARARVTNCSFTTTGTGHDGVHIDGPSSDIHIANCYFATGDDAIALNAPEGFGGDISRVTVTNCIFNGSLTVMRIYTSIDAAHMPTNNTHKVRNVAVSNCVGTTGVQCFNLGISNGISATNAADQIQDFSVVNCSLSSPLGLAYLLTPIGSITFSNVKFIPTSTAPVISCFFPSVGELEVSGLRVVRNPDGNAAPASVVFVYNTASMDRVTLSNLAVVDEEDSSYAALPSVIDAQGGIAALRLEGIDMTHVAALFSAAGTGSVGVLRGGGVLGTGAQVPDALMDSNALYLSSNAGGALSVKIAGTAKRVALA